MIMGQKCRVRAADAVDVQVAYNKTVAAKGAMAASLNRDAVSSKGPDMYTVYYEKVSGESERDVEIWSSNYLARSLTHTFFSITAVFTPSYYFSRLNLFNTVLFWQVVRSN